MNKKKIIQELKKIDFKGIKSLSDEIESAESPKDILYSANIIVFQSSSINHKERLSLLKKINKISLKHKLHFCCAHNLTLSIKVSKELGIQNNLIKDSHKVIELWKKILDQPLAINGLIFIYTDLGLLFSEYSLNSLGIKYLDKAKSLIDECENSYNPFIKLYVAYAIIYNKMKDEKKSTECYQKVIKLAESKKDSLTLIPILINTATSLIEDGNYKNAKKQCKKALTISKENSDKIYRPYIYLTLGKIYLIIDNYNKSKFYLEKALESFNTMDTTKMIPEVLYNIGNLFCKKGENDKALLILSDTLKKNKKIKDYSLDIKILKKISEIHKRRKDVSKRLLIANQLNKVLEDQINSKERIFSEITSKALKYLSEEFNSSLVKNSKLKLKLNIESEKRKLTTKTLVSVSEREFLNKTIKQLSDQQLDNMKIISLLKDRLHHTKDWNIFMKLFNDIHPDFNKYLIKKCSAITESELRICTLIKMNFSSLEIADILSISKRGVEQHRYRIKKKLELEADLTIFVQSI